MRRRTDEIKIVLKDPFENGTEYGRLTGDDLLSLLHLTNASAFDSIDAATPELVERARNHVVYILRRVIDWWHQNDHKHVAECLIMAHGGGPYEESLVDKLDWLDDRFCTDQRDMAKKVLLDIVDWWHDTPSKRIDELNAAHHKSFDAYRHSTGDCVSVRLVGTTTHSGCGGAA